MEASGDLVVVDSGLAAVLRVVATGPNSGNCTIVSNATTGNGSILTIFSNRANINIEDSGQLVVVSNSFIVRVDTIDSDRAVISIGNEGIIIFED